MSTHARPMSEAESRVRRALDSGQTPAAGDVSEVMAELDRARREAEERWEAIGQLAPAAKAHRARSHAQARTMESLGQHLDALAARLASPGALDADAVNAWLCRARQILTGR